MIKDKIVVKRYANAFMSFAKDTIGLEKAIREFHDLKANVIRENPQFMEILRSEGITHAEKRDFIDRVLSDDFSRELKQFLKFLLDKHRIDKLIDIIEYVRIEYSHGQEIEALLKTSFPLEVELIKEIEVKLEARFHKKFKFYIDLDGSLLGGVQVVMGNNTILDGSVRKRLDELKEKMMEVRV